MKINVTGISLGVLTTCIAASSSFAQERFVDGSWNIQPLPVENETRLLTEKELAAELTGAVGSTQDAESKSVSAGSKLTVNGYAALVTGPAPFTISALDFTCASGSDAGCRTTGSGYITGVNVSAASCFAAPLKLPSGVTIGRFEATVYDNLNGDTLSLSFVRTSITGDPDGNAEEIATLTTDDVNDAAALQQLTTTAILNPVVQYPDYYYWLLACPWVNQRIYSVQVYLNPE